MAEAAKTVWITRAEPGASATAARIKALGFDPVVAPLLSFRDKPAMIDLLDGEVLAFTSAHAVERTAALIEERHMAVFAVGDITADAARRAGFTNVLSASGDVIGLAALIVEHQPEGRVLHPAATETAGDLTGRLQAGGVRARRIAVYETIAAASAPPELRRRRGNLFAALLHSPKAAHAAAAIVATGEIDPKSMTALGLSPACIEPLQALGFDRLIAAPHPTEDALLGALVQASKGRLL